MSVGYDFSVPLPSAPPGSTLRGALETIALRALQRPPCVVSFSGGRDSSIVLAIATDVAAREGLTPPVPVTLRFPQDRESDETSYQEMVVGHLGLPDWQRLTLTDEMDLLGPIAQPFLRRHGVAVPANAYFHCPIVEQAQGGSVLTGVGGDELFTERLFHRANLVLSGRRRPAVLDPLRILVALLPQRLRALAVRLRFPNGDEPLPWLNTGANAELMRVWRAESGQEMLSFAGYVRDVLWPDRDRILGLTALQALAEDEGVLCLSPFADAEVLAAAAAERGWKDFGSRAAATAGLTGHLLPPALAARPTKATFDTSFVNHYTRDFVERWDPTTLPADLADLVDVEAARQTWAATTIDFDARSASLLQAAWLAQNPHASADTSRS